MPVHLRGEPADMEAIGAIAEARGLAVIEDAAQAHGARHRGRRVGGLGDAAAFSFYPSKNLGALGDGGALTTDDEELAEKARLLRNYGMRNRYEIEAAGVNSRLAEIQAAVLAAKLPRLDGWNRERAAHAEAYRVAFAGREGIRLPQPPPWAEPVWHLFVVNHHDRDACRDSLAAAGIEALVHYPVLPHLSGAYPAGRWSPGSFPVAEELARTTLSLPLYPQMAAPAREAVVEAMIAAAAETAPRPA